MELKPEVLICIDWFLPGYKAGGPIKSVFNIVTSLKEDYSFSILCSDTDFGEMIPYEGIATGVWLQQNGYRVMYLGRKAQSIFFIKNLMQEKNYDVIYLNSLFSTRFTLFPLLAHKASGSKAKVILAPRGMLGMGALNLKKRKKQVFLSFAKAAGIYKNITWHASTALEADEIRANFGNNERVKIATNISALTSGLVFKANKTPQNTTFFFLSRVSRKKNLLGALKLLSKIELSNNIYFKIIGPIEDTGYWEECQSLISTLSHNILVEYLGAVPNMQLPALLKNYHFLLLPTFSENFGHVVVESWQAGCPVIISDQTPWQNLSEAGVGWEIPLANESDFIKILQQCVNMEQFEYEVLSKQTQQYLRQHVMTDEILEQNKALFRI